MPPSTISKRLLPPFVLQELAKHPMMTIHQPWLNAKQAHDYRTIIKNWNSPNSPDIPLAMEHGEGGFTIEARRSMLHRFSMLGDVLDVLEFLYYGANPDIRDTSGISPLYLTLIHLRFNKLYPTHILKDREGAETTIAYLKCCSLRLAFVARILIEQHADVNVTHKGTPLLHIACDCRDWDTIELLLRHGAKVTHNISSCFHTNPDKIRFVQLVKSIGKFSKRPPRICPCWSGLTVDNCHGKGKKPYPLHYMCTCASGKSYKSCCFKFKEYPVFEHWDYELQKIVQGYDEKSGVPPVYQGLYDEMSELTLELAELVGFDWEAKTLRQLKAQHLEEGIQRIAPMLDPAYAYAMQKTKSVVRPIGRSYSKASAATQQERWNRAVDDYIANEDDPRSKEEIERAAKVGSYLGALIRVCEAVGCEKVERKDVEALKLCTRCKRAAYCSQKCQKSAWKAHKTVCGTANQLEQHLPSQNVLAKMAVDAEEELRANTELLRSKRDEVRQLYADRDQLLQEMLENGDFDFWGSDDENEEGEWESDGDFDSDTSMS